MEKWYAVLTNSTEVLQYSVTVPNAGGNTTANITLMHLWGSAYDMGI